MGSISRMSRCDRFRRQLEDQLVAKSPLQPGDWVEVIGVSVSQSEDGAEVSKLYVTVRNKRTGDEECLTTDACLYNPEGSDEDNVASVTDYLHAPCSDEEYEQHRKKVIASLQKAELISKGFK